MSMNNSITIQTTIALGIADVWERYVDPTHVVHWNYASPDWQCTSAQSDVREHGTFSYRMEAKDGSVGFDFTGTFTDVRPPHRCAYTMDDGRMAEVLFSEAQGATTVTISFEPEQEQSIALQQQGWQAILDNFKQYAESLE